MASVTFPSGFRCSYVDVINGPRSPMVSSAIDRGGATRTVDVDWDNAEQFHINVLGWSESSTAVASGSADSQAYIMRYPPWRFPLLTSKTVTNIAPDSRPMVVHESSFEGYGVPTDKICYSGTDDTYCARYKKARFTLRYNTPTYEVMSDIELSSRQKANGELPWPLDESKWRRYITRNVRPQGETFTIESGAQAYYYAAVSNNGAALPIVQSLNKIIASSNVSITWHQVPYICVPARMFDLRYSDATLDGIGGLDIDLPNPAIDRCIGRVNDRTFNGFRQGTLLLLAVEIKPIMSAINARQYDITYMFKHLQPSRDYRGVTSGGAQIAIFPGNNHVYLPYHKIPAAIRAPTGNVSPGWYEAINDATKAITAPRTNFGVKEEGRNIYDFANFANLFRPQNYPG